MQRIGISAIGELDHELKFVLPAHRTDMVTSVLNRCCCPDPDFPVGIVTSIYYDTPSLHLLYEKVNSDYLKTKIRVRWYSDPTTGVSAGSAFAEAKFRIGTRRRKVRQATVATGEWLRRQPLTRADLVRIPECLRRAGVRTRQPLQPLITVSYVRHRFIEPATGLRIALDRGIRSVAVNPRLATARTHHCLRVAVLEIKGKSRHLPASLRSATRLGCRRQSFSKLISCFEAATWNHS